MSKPIFRDTTEVRNHRSEAAIGIEGNLGGKRYWVGAGWTDAPTVSGWTDEEIGEMRERERPSLMEQLQANLKTK